MGEVVRKSVRLHGCAGRDRGVCILEIAMARLVAATARRLGGRTVSEKPMGGFVMEHL